MIIRICLPTLMWILALVSGHAGATALELTLSESGPVWLPQQLNIESLQGRFPCQGGQCHFRGQLEFHREDGAASVNVNATLSRGPDTLAIRGDVRLGSGAGNGRITGGELRLTGLRPWLPRSMPVEVRRLIPSEATLTFAPADQPSPGQWPMKVSLTTRGGAQPAFHGRLVLHTGEPWRLEIREGRLTAALAHWQQAGWAFRALRADLPVTGTITADGSRLTFAESAAVTVQHMDAFEPEQLMWLDQVSLSPGGATMEFHQGRSEFRGPMTLTAGEVRVPGLVTQSWRAKADVQWRQGLALDGSLHSGSGTALPFHVRYQPGGPMNATINMAVTADNETNHLAETLAHWPEGLALDDGRVDVSVSVEQQAGGAAGVRADLAFGDASGLYRNMAWQGLSGGVEGQWQGDTLTVSTRALELAQLNPGIVIGPIRLQAVYQAPVASPSAGELQVERASAGFADGTLSLEHPLNWTLSQPPWRAPMTVEGVELSALMNLYPTEGLAGEGTLDGRLPIHISRAGVSIDNGRIHALPPGGRLQLPADRLAGMAQANQAMALVARAMEDFHYRVLESDIHYAEDGALELDLTLKGSSPEVDSDRPVVLNINLQEDIPALLTSLQLSGRVNEAVQERVRERLMQEDVDSQ